MAKKSTETVRAWYEDGVALRLLVVTAQTDPPPSVLIKGRRVVLGRAAHCDVRIPDPTVSLEHAIIVRRGPNYLLMDQGSRHGTAVALADSPPVLLAPDAPRVLENGERIWLGQIELEVRMEASTRGEREGFDTLAPSLVRIGLETIGVEATPAKVQAVLQELTELPDDLEPPVQASPPEPLQEEVGILALAEDDEHPPWITDAFLGGMAILLAAGCVYGLIELAHAF